jgi:PAS domain S-box-containing protein
MGQIQSFEHCLLLRVGVVGEGEKCVSIARLLSEVKASRLRVRVVAMSLVDPAPLCRRYAAEKGILLVERPRDLLTVEGVDLVLELSGREALLAELVRHKPPSVGVMDRQASELFFQVAGLERQAARRESEISLATSFATALLEASPDAVMVIDRNYRIVRCNDHELIAGGRGRQEAVGKYCFQVMHGALSPCGGPERVCPMAQTLATGKPARALHEITGKDGKTRICHVTTYPLVNHLGEIIQVVDVIRDITADLSDQVERRTRHLKDDLARFVQEDRLISLGRLVASVCHEINNPIMSIVTFNKLLLSYLRDDQLPPSGLDGFRHYLELSVREALRCGEIVKNLLSFARQKHIEAGPIDLAEMIRTITLLIDHQRKQAGVELRLDLPQEPFTAWGDPSQIQQCLMNLVFNALDAMPQGGVLTISGGVGPGEDMVFLRVSDTGCGIDPEVLPHIFEPFFSTKDEGKGVGLGLSMVYGIVREHHGTVEVESQPGQGATFTIHLPASPPPGKEEAS